MTKIEEIKQLKELLDSGALSWEEFETEKQKILSRSDNAASFSSPKGKVNANIWERLCSLVKSTKEMLTKYRIQLMQTSINAANSGKRNLHSLANTAIKMANRYRKQLVQIFIVCALILIAIAGCSLYQRHEAQRKAEIDAQEKAYKDSIAAVEKARKDSIAAVIQARKDSIAAVEQARQDSIDRIEHAAFVKKYSSIGLIITHLEMTRGKDSDGDGTKGIEFKIFNPTNKTIKYVIANMVAVNGVGDVMSYEKRCRGIGPVAPHDYGYWNFDDVFYDKNDIIDDLSVSFTVIYTNGSSKNIKWKTAYNNDFSSYWFEE